MHKLRRLQKFIFFFCCLLLLLSLLLLQCAHPVTPQGGPQDVKPPAVVNCTPPNGSIRFTGSEIRITFDEFIQLKSPVNEVFISPPPGKNPSFKLRGKTVLVQFEDSLQPETTYIINFGKAISDITENNVTENLMYIFSTGDAIDSLQIHGSVTDAFTNKPEPEVFVLLYTDSNDTIPFDSLPYKVPPRYITRTNDQGAFSLVYLARDQYKVFALSDKSGDLMFNTSNERIAFADSLVIPVYFIPEASDTLVADSICADTVASDTLVPDTSHPGSQQPHPYPDPMALRMFEETDSTQEVLKSQLVKKDQFILVFRFPTHDLHIAPLNPDSVSGWIQETNARHDTVFLWTTDPLPDTLGLIVYDQGECLDTLLIYPTIEKKGKPKKKETEENVTPPPSLSFSWKPTQGEFNHFKNTLTGMVSYPVTHYEPGRILLITGKDTTTLPPLSFIDSLQRMFSVSYPWQESTTYSILIPDSVFTSYNGISHDTIVHSFKTATARDLGSLMIKVGLPGETDQYIFQLQNEQGVTLEESVLMASGEIRFPFIRPGKYNIKAILDKNKNGQWDTGSYLQHIQPEMVFFFPSIIEIRGNWDVEEEWTIR